MTLIVVVDIFCMYSLFNPLGSAELALYTSKQFLLSPNCNECLSSPEFWPLKILLLEEILIRFFHFQFNMDAYRYQKFRFHRLQSLPMI